MSNKYKDIFAAAAEVMGLILAYMDRNMHVSKEVERERGLAVCLFVLIGECG